MQWNKHVWSLFLHILPDFSINSAESVAKTLNIPFLTLDISKQNGVRVNFRKSLRRHNVIYTCATFSRAKALAKWWVTATTHRSVTSCMQIRAQFRLFQVKAMFKQRVNLMIWTWILRRQTASRNKFPCKNTHYSRMFFIAYAFKGQVHVFAGRVKIVSHLSCRTCVILKYFCPLKWKTCCNTVILSLLFIRPSCVDVPVDIINSGLPLNIHFKIPWLFPDFRPFFKPFLKVNNSHSHLSAIQKFFTNIYACWFNL